MRRLDHVERQKAEQGQGAIHISGHQEITAQVLQKQESAKNTSAKKRLIAPDLCQAEK